MQFFIKWLVKKLSDYHSNQLCGEPNKIVVRDDSFGGPKRIDFSLFLADGGVVLKSAKMDPKTERWNERLMVIHEDQDIAAKVGDFVSIEVMRM